MNTLPFQIIPLEYQGWTFLIFLAIAFAALLYGFYFMLTDEKISGGKK